MGNVILWEKGPPGDACAIIQMNVRSKAGQTIHPYFSFILHGLSASFYPGVTHHAFDYN
jgi:hypothetical protein